MEQVSYLSALSVDEKSAEISNIAKFRSGAPLKFVFPSTEDVIPRIYLFQRLKHAASSALPTAFFETSCSFFGKCIPAFFHIRLVA